MRNYPTGRKKSNKYCVICGLNNNHADIYGFGEVLRDMQIEGVNAHPICVLEEQARRRKQTRKCG